MKDTFVFFHVGIDVKEPTMLVSSIAKSNPDADIIQCSDLETPAIEGVTRLFRLEGNSNHLMTFRIRAFSELQLQQPAIYLDTDMIVTKQLKPAFLLGDKAVLLCKREFGQDLYHTGSMRGVSFPEHKGRLLGEVYPYLACASITRDYTLWSDLHGVLGALDSRFHIWYGDQEAMRYWVDTKASDELVGFLPESKFACLPEESDYVANAFILHFKGAARKSLMREAFNFLRDGAQ